MQIDTVTAFVLAGGQGKRLHPLTEKHAKPALPFADGYRIIDFVLSNLINSGIRSIYVVAQYKPASLIHHLLETWMPFARAHPTLQLDVVMPAPDSDGFRGTADAVYQSLWVLERHSADLIAVFAADHIYRMDLRQMVTFHHDAAAEVSIAARPVGVAEASRFGIMATDRSRRVTAFQEKPTQPLTIPGDPSRAYASMGNYLFKPRTLVRALTQGQQSGATDFGKDLLPRLIPWQRVFAYDFRTNIVPGVRPYEEPTYWRDVGTVQALREARRDTEGARPRFDLSNRAWPIIRAAASPDRHALPPADQRQHA